MFRLRFTQVLPVLLLALGLVSEARAGNVLVGKIRTTLEKTPENSHLPFLALETPDTYEALLSVAQRICETLPSNDENGRARGHVLSLNYEEILPHDLEQLIEEGTYFADAWAYSIDPQKKPSLLDPRKWFSPAKKTITVFTSLECVYWFIEIGHTEGRIKESPLKADPKRVRRRVKIPRSENYANDNDASGFSDLSIKRRKALRDEDSEEEVQLILPAEPLTSINRLVQLKHFVKNGFIDKPDFPFPHYQVVSDLFERWRVIYYGPLLEDQWALNDKLTGRFAFVVLQNFRCIISFDQQLGTLGSHELLARQTPVFGAGEVEFLDGELVDWNLKSGTYCMDARFKKQVPFSQDKFRPSHCEI